ncbi:MAG: helix-turn-helix domain-containing protein, partial [Tepidiformaceae bacterium]
MSRSPRHRSRKTGYKWLERFDAEGVVGLEDRSRAPHSCPHRMPDEIRDALLAARRLHPTWGPKKLLQGAVSHARLGLVLPAHDPRPPQPLLPGTPGSRQHRRLRRAPHLRACVPRGGDAGRHPARQRTALRGAPGAARAHA